MVTKLEEMCNLRGNEPDTVVVRFVPRAEELPCGRDALGKPLTKGEPMVCLCCGARGFARVLTEDEIRWGEGFDSVGSQWVSVAEWLTKILPPSSEKQNVGT